MLGNNENLLIFHEEIFGPVAALSIINYIVLTRKKKQLRLLALTTNDMAYCYRPSYSQGISFSHGMDYEGFVIILSAEWSLSTKVP